MDGSDGYLPKMKLKNNASAAQLPAYLKTDPASSNPYSSKALAMKGSSSRNMQIVHKRNSATTTGAMSGAAATLGKPKSQSILVASSNLLSKIPPRQKLEEGVEVVQAAYGIPQFSGL